MRAKHLLNFIVSLTLILSASGAFVNSATAQAVVAARSNKVEERQLKSKLMARDMPYRVILPANYSTKPNEKFPVIYLLHGLTGNYKNWIDKTDVEQFSFGYDFVIVTAEGNNGWYTDSATVPNDKFESYIIKELITEIEKDFRVVGDRDHRMIAGLSMGGYGSLKLGLKYPEMFSLVGSFSGALGAATWSEKTAGSNIGKPLELIYGADGSETRNSNDIFKIVRESTSERIKGLPFIYQSCGTEDFLIANNREFLALMNEKKIAHEYREHPGIHDWVFWNDQVREFLAVADRRLRK
ncbi:MAG TPA: alpha/beta hydrolase family protein [Pyrinomonadaceae bacterium]|nr:esterase family protein [Chloracidobacterium sp.]MBK7804653.1 esterase family protein [Chloracidobacterium sp.]MBL0240573.1 esterase family protein [Chloracidobacterium sp.]MBP9934641.1 esterase family protein [Pyrinomonadaceae bacterium]HRA41454.1 alpha/beta hydrolase family protein [Pyrinomonadaceae bacterium]